MGVVAGSVATTPDRYWPDASLGAEAGMRFWVLTGLAVYDRFHLWARMGKDVLTRVHSLWARMFGLSSIEFVEIGIEDVLGRMRLES